MSTGDIERYVFEREDGQPCNYATYDPVEARQYGQTHGLLVIAHTYTWEDSEVAWDFREEAE